jgi:hypothetical protein
VGLVLKGTLKDLLVFGLEGGYGFGYGYGYGGGYGEEDITESSEPSEWLTSSGVYYTKRAYLIEIE